MVIQSLHGDFMNNIGPLRISVRFHQSTLHGATERCFPDATNLLVANRLLPKLMVAAKTVRSNFGGMREFHAKCVRFTRAGRSRSPISLIKRHGLKYAKSFHYEARPVKSKIRARTIPFVLPDLAYIFRFPVTQPVLHQS
jgi:hypothetical protein